jgi:hypothetical protein
MQLGNLWRLRVFPGGCDDAGDGMVTLDLYNESNKAIEIEYGFIIIDGSGKQVAYKRSAGPSNFGPVGTADNGRRYTNFVNRSTLSSSLVDGTLVIEIQMRLVKPTKSLPPIFIPENPSSCKTIQGVFLDDK